MGWKDLTKDWLAFSRKERIGIISIIFLIFLIWLSPELLHNLGRTRQVEADSDSGWAALAKNIHSKSTEMKYETGDETPDSLVFERSIDPKSSKSELFYFDPNKLPAKDWKRLGINDKTIHTIQNYLGKGWRFYKPADLLKIYGFKAADYARLEPYIKIENETKERDFEKEKSGIAAPVSKLKTIDVNLADTTGFISLPGIGTKLAARIVNFREKLGGFYSIDQVGETYGLADTIFQKLKKYLSISNSPVKTFNINTATKDELKIHPYIKWQLANAIVEYRNQHGNFSSIEDLKKISLVTDELYEKILPYLSL